MDRYALLADIVTVAANCVGNTTNGCQYSTFVSNGQPPADCTHIAAYWVSSDVIPGSRQCLTSVRETFRVSLNIACLTNVGEEFDPVKEDNDAMCFLTDFGNLLECLICEAEPVIATYVNTGNNVSVSAAVPDNMVRGMAYGGFIDIKFTRVQPCNCP